MSSDQHLAPDDGLDVLTGRDSNPLEEYRRAQRNIRRLFDPFTRVHCPTCATPCCRKPVRILPTDLILVEELTGGLRGGGAALGEAIQGHLAPAGATVSPGSPCDFLTGIGCSFPDDLRPFGCAVDICLPMRRELPESELHLLDEAAAELHRSHERLMHHLHSPPGG